MAKEQREHPYLKNCSRCRKAFEVVGNWGTGKEVTQSTPCPYGCGEMNEFVWPVDGTWFVRKIPSEMFHTTLNVSASDHRQPGVSVAGLDFSTFSFAVPIKHR